jgi:hypothetical protein
MPRRSKYQEGTESVRVLRGHVADFERRLDTAQARLAEAQAKAPDSAAIIASRGILVGRQTLHPSVPIGVGAIFSMRIRRAPRGSGLSHVQCEATR